MVELGVMLDRVQALMTEQLFNVIEIGPAPDQFRRAGATEGVRAHVIGQPGLSDVPLKDAAEGEGRIYIVDI